MYKIEHNIPIPSGRCKYPLKEMEIGDSFLIPMEDTIGKSSGVAGRLVPQASRHGIKIRVYKVEDGYRVWRIA